MFSFTLRPLLPQGSNPPVSIEHGPVRTFGEGKKSHTYAVNRTRNRARRRYRDFAVTGRLLQSACQQLALLTAGHLLPFSSVPLQESGASVLVHSTCPFCARDLPTHDAACLSAVLTLSSDGLHTLTEPANRTFQKSKDRHDLSYKQKLPQTHETETRQCMLRHATRS
jgi:hypothetical protein